MWDCLKQFLYENTLGTAEERINVLENRSGEIIQNVDKRHNGWKYKGGLFINIWLIPEENEVLNR